MSDTATALALRSEVEALLHREAALLDARDFDGWLELFADDATYWIPSNSDELDPRAQVSIVYERRAQLQERVWRLGSGIAYAQEPQSRTTHLVSNVEVLDHDDEHVEAASAFVVAEFRRERRFLHAGRSSYRLRRAPGGLLIVLKKVALIDNDGYFGNLSLVI